MPHRGTGTPACTPSSAACPTTPADRWLRRLSTLANHGQLWLLTSPRCSGARKGSLRRGAIRGIGSMAVSSAAGQRRPQAAVRPGPARPGQPAHRPPAAPRAAHACPSPAGTPPRRRAFVTGVAMENTAAGAALAPLALGVGYSRVHVGVHYPGDVVAGPRRRRRGGRGQHALVAGPADDAGPRPPRARGAGAARRRGAGRRGQPAASGDDDYDPAEDIRQLLPRAEVLEMSRARRRRRPARARPRAPAGPGRSASPAATAASPRPPRSPSSTGCRWRSSRPARSTTSPATSASRPRRTPRTPSARGRRSRSTSPRSTGRRSSTPRASAPTRRWSGAATSSPAGWASGWP